ncbi:MAG: palindromic element RPE4 domain-containing protein [Rickettsia endosymbiont of Stiretrus anchorago]|nr:palindromic element RPE4 domain-containing protein [Rickettsia endosymbiont of Stiretrus anchorago]
MGTRSSKECRYKKLDFSRFILNPVDKPRDDTDLNKNP